MTFFFLHKKKTPADHIFYGLMMWTEISYYPPGGG
jgi:hypothetical protein